MSKNKFDFNRYKITNGKSFSLSEYNPKEKDKEVEKSDAKIICKEDIEELSKLQDVLYASKKNSILIILQGRDACGKDTTVKHIMSGVNPAGVKVTSFKSPSTIELEHDYIWRHYIALPPKGEIGIFNRSHYENILVTKVHPEYIQTTKKIDKKFWKNRYKQIRNFEKTLIENDTVVLKFFLNVSKDEQKKRFLDRIDDSSKNWKFSSADLKEREFWDEYQKAFQDAIKNTSTNDAPWYVIPADNKWYARFLIGGIITDVMKKLNLSYPIVSEEDKVNLQKAKEKLINE
ncbi:polyphosphate kinase 2 family protein [bacterium]|jgi:PPK2 family polyphosphate:nucleotide phosphotransferase|nr:polyphosphate kinase 2 family protein [bacterium]